MTEIVLGDERFKKGSKKSPRVPRQTPRPGPGTVMPRRPSPGRTWRQRGSPVLYDTGGVVIAYIVVAYAVIAYIVMPCSGDADSRDGEEADIECAGANSGGAVVVPGLMAMHDVMTGRASPVADIIFMIIMIM